MPEEYYAKVWKYCASFTHVHLLKGVWLISHLGLVQINLQERCCTGFCVDIARNFSRVNAVEWCWVVWPLNNDTFKQGASQLFPGRLISPYTCVSCLTGSSTFDVATLFFVKILIDGQYHLSVSRSCCPRGWRGQNWTSFHVFVGHSCCYFPLTLYSFESSLGIPVISPFLGYLICRFYL